MGATQKAYIHLAGAAGTGWARNRAEGTDLRQGHPEQRVERWSLPRDITLSVVPSRMSILITCVLITGVGIISLMTHLFKRRRSQRNRRSKQWLEGRREGQCRENKRDQEAAFKWVNVTSSYCLDPWKPMQPASGSGRFYFMVTKAS